MDPDGHRRVPAVKAGQQTREIDPAERRDRTDRKPPAHQPADRGNRVPTVLGRGDGALRGWQQRTAGLGQLDLARAANEKVTTQLVLERPDRAREARLRQVDPSRGSREVTLLDDGQKVGKLAQLH